MKTHILTAMCLLSLVTLVTGCAKQAQPEPAKSVETPVPDSRGRTLAKKMRVNPVEEIKVYGPNLMRFEDDPIRIRDQKQIARIQKALETAQTRWLEVANRVDKMEVRYQSVKGKRPPDDYINININSPIDCFGQEFHQLLHEITRDYQEKAAR